MSTDVPAAEMDFRNAMARFASGVTIVTTHNAHGEAVGFTASAFSSLSLKPPLLLVCLQKDADCYAAFMATEHFAVSILAHGQDDIARRFATKAIDKWQDTQATPGERTRIPVIDGAAAQTECLMLDRVDGGDHTILIGEVISAVSTPAEPLLHFNRQFGRFVGEEPSK
ncbi:MAG TPA: flavin reductase family protein [Dehalococcoidia bacterium]|jgi:flavin reductase ActVB|nr:flavin reductase family protein [Dehalococcoidia bacterium]